MGSTSTDAEQTLDRLKQALPHLFLTEADAGNDETGIFYLSHGEWYDEYMMVMFNGFAAGRKFRFQPLIPFTCYDDLRNRHGPYGADSYFNEHGELLLDWKLMGRVGWCHTTLDAEQRAGVDEYYGDMESEEDEPAAAGA